MVMDVDAGGGLDRVGIMLSIMGGRTSGLNVCLINARSIRNKIEEIKSWLLNNNNLHVILVNETWLRDDIPSVVVSIPGFDLHRNDRKDRVGGGVAVYVRNCFRSRVIYSSTNDDIEFLSVEVNTSIEKCVFTSTYCPPGNFNNNSMEEFENAMYHISRQYEKVIVGGDFNVNVLRNDSMSATFLNFAQTLHLRPVNEIATYYNTTNPSLLDLFLTSDPGRVLFHSQIDPPSSLDHDILFMSYDIAFNPVDAYTSYTFRDYRNIDDEAMMEECANLPWSNILASSSVDCQVEMLSYLCGYLFEKYVPIKTKYIRVGECPWFNREIKMLIAEREYLYQRCKRLKTEEAKMLYKAARNRATSAIRLAKYHYFASKLNPSLDPKTLWSNLRKSGVCGKEPCNLHYSPNELNLFFTSNNSYVPINQSTSSSSSSLYHDNFSGSYNEFSFRRVELDELISAIYSIKSTASGLDNLSPKFIKRILPAIAPYILHIINSCLTFSVFPHSWKVAAVLPVPKKPNPESPSDYRPISILCFLSKVLEKLMYWQIMSYLRENVLLTPWQSGFRASRSCETALLKVSTDLRSALDDNKFSALVLLDFSKAFDCVNHTILLRKLLSIFNFDSSAIALISSFLTNRSQMVKTKDSLSNPLPITRGVPQGSVLGPLLFCLFINDLPQAVKDVEIHLYADDVQLYLSRPIGLIEDCISRINSDLDRINVWATSNELLLNPNKSQCIGFYSGNLDLCDIPPIILRGVTLPFQHKVNNLGIVLSRDFKCCANVNAILSKVYGGLRRLRLFAKILPIDLRLKLVKSLIVPHFTYGSLIYPKLDSVCSRRIEVAFNDCVRFVFGLRRFDHISSYKCKILGCSIESYLQRRALTFMYNLIHTREPAYLADQVCGTSSRRNCNLIPPRFTKNIMGDSFFVQTIRLWNSLPTSVQSVGTVGAFKQAIKLCVP